MKRVSPFLKWLTILLCVAVVSTYFEEVDGFQDTTTTGSNAGPTGTVDPNAGATGATGATGASDPNPFNFDSIDKPTWIAIGIGVVFFIVMASR
jgi:hypothetical protein